MDLKTLLMDTESLLILKIAKISSVTQLITMRVLVGPNILLPNCTGCPGLSETRKVLHKQQQINESCECLLSSILF